MGKRGQEATERTVEYFYLESRKMSNEQKEEGEQTGCPSRVVGRRFSHRMIHDPFKRLSSLSSQQLAQTGIMVPGSKPARPGLLPSPGQCAGHTQRVRTPFGVLVWTGEFP